MFAYPSSGDVVVLGKSHTLSVELLLCSFEVMILVTLQAYTEGLCYFCIWSFHFSPLLFPVLLLLPLCPPPTLPLSRYCYQCPCPCDYSFQMQLICLCVLVSIAIFIQQIRDKQMFNGKNTNVKSIYEQVQHHIFTLYTWM